MPKEITVESLAPEMLEACREAWRYNLAIAQRAADGNYDIDARRALAQGVDLDQLYVNWMEKVYVILRKLDDKLLKDTHA